MPLPATLLEGHFRFRRDVHARDRGRYQQLAELGQAPTAMVVGCCDARVDVSLIFDAKPGDLFILRNVANLVPPFEPEGRYHGTSAAIGSPSTIHDPSRVIPIGTTSYRSGSIASITVRAERMETSCSSN